MSSTSLMNQSIALYTAGGFDRYGKEQVGSATTVRARVQQVSKVRILPNGTQYTIEAIIYVPSDTTISEGDKIRFDTKNFRVHGISTAIDGRGNTEHKKIEVTKWLTS